MSDFEYFERPDWPPLAWLAECTKNESRVRVIHGSRVETAPDWFCEAVWAGGYEAGNFDGTDIVFGSGGRRRDGEVIFVSSGSTVDRLQFLRKGDAWFVSNSLACLHAAAGGWLSCEYRLFPEFFTSIINGLDRYERIIPEAGPELVYFRNVAWDGRKLDVVNKPAPPRELSCFHAYRGFLQDALHRLGDNMRSGQRRHSLDWIGSISSGYDSPTIAVLAQAAGLRKVISFANAREGNEDSGQEIATLLGLEVTVLDRLAWRKAPMTEVPFLAADAKGEDILFASGHAQMRNRVLLTGYHGDKVWEKNTSTLTPDIVRGDQSGLSLAEYRLLVGMIHVPVPFMAARNIREINAISHGAEMQPWDIGGGYNRPICRRIVEEAGVPRHLFGQAKKAASNLFQRGETCFTPEARADYRKWHRSLVRSSRGSQAHRLPREPWLGRFRIPEIWALGDRLLFWVSGVLPARIRRSVEWRLYMARYWMQRYANYFFQHAFPWALDRLADLYRADCDTSGTRPVRLLISQGPCDLEYGRRRGKAALPKSPGVMPDDSGSIGVGE